MSIETRMINIVMAVLLVIIGFIYNDDRLIFVAMALLLTAILIELPLEKEAEG